MTEDNKITLNKVICTQCKATLLIRPTEKRCPVCGGLLPHTDERNWRLRQWFENGNIHSWQSLPQVWRHWAAPNKTQFLDALSARKQVLSMWALWGEVFLCAWSSLYQLAIWRGCLAWTSGLIFIHQVVSFTLSLPAHRSGTFRNNLGI